MGTGGSSDSLEAKVLERKLRPALGEHSDKTHPSTTSPASATLGITALQTSGLASSSVSEDVHYI